ncbi:hypothetical protein GA8_16350 [Geobacillus sp. A8]|nr:hypothetical protein GA8_16350 [Geobacillus sp. A8]
MLLRRKKEYRFALQRAEPVKAVDRAQSDTMRLPRSQGGLFT